MYPPFFPQRKAHLKPSHAVLCVQHRLVVRCKDKTIKADGSQVPNMPCPATCTNKASTFAALLGGWVSHPL